MSSSIECFQYWNVQDKLFNELGTKLFEEETKNEWYRVTSALGARLMEIDGVRGLFYPTAQNNWRGVNIAMPERYAAKRLQAFEAWLIHFGDRIDPPGRGGPRLAEYYVARRGGFDKAGNIGWGSEGCWDAHRLHLAIAPGNQD